MPTLIGQKLSHRKGIEGSTHAETGVATLWLAFYAVALGVTISSPLVSRSIEFTALISD